MLHFEPFDGTIEQWDAVLDHFPDREVFQTSAWLRFLVESQSGTLVLAVLKDDSDIVGYFAGVIVRKFGLRILGSPFIGWTTDRMGIRLRQGVSRRAAVEALMQYAFRDLKCVHLELADLNITPDDVAGLGFESRVGHGYVVDLTPDEDTVFHNMSAKSARYCVRKAANLGVVVEEAHDEQFADDYNAQMQEVFANQGLVPTYGKDRTLLLMRHLLPTGHLLLLRRAPDGRCIATGIFLGMNRRAYFWGNASWNKDRHFCPNEPLIGTPCATGSVAAWNATTCAAPASTNASTEASPLKTISFQNPIIRGLPWRQRSRSRASGSNSASSGCGTAHVTAITRAATHGVRTQEASDERQLEANDRQRTKR